MKLIKILIIIILITPLIYIFSSFGVSATGMISIISGFAIIPHKHNVALVKESDLKRKSAEHQLSLIIDTMLNIERMSK